MKQLSSSKRLIVKIGSSLIIDNSVGKVRKSWLESLAFDVLSAKKRGTDVVLVSSGAIAIGRSLLKLKNTNLSLEESQAAAAVGQIKLSAPTIIATWEASLSLSPNLISSVATVSFSFTIGTTSKDNSIFKVVLEFK